MGDAIKFVQTATMPAGGTYEIVYTHDPRGKPSRVGLIAASITSGTRTGASCIFYGNDPTNMVCLSHHAHTPSNYSNTVHPNLVIHPGQCIKIYFQAVTAGDGITVTIGGH